MAANAVPDRLLLARAAVGIDVGGTEIKGVVANSVESLGEPCRGRTPPDSRDLIDAVVEIASNLLDRARSQSVGVVAVGVGIPGLISPTDGAGVLSANLGWDHFEIRDVLSARLGLPVHIEHDVYLGGLAELSIGAGRNRASVAFVPLGTGAGSLLMINGSIWRGSTGIAGEIGHIPDTTIADDCGCGGSGCIELVASARGLERVYAAMGGSHAGSSAEAIAAAARSGDSMAAAAWDRCLGRIAAMLAGLVTTTEVETVILGGGLSAAGDQLLRPLRRALAEHLPPLLESPGIASRGAWRHAGARGAALHALQAVATRRPQRREAPPPENLDPVLMLAFDHRSSTAEGLFGDSIPLAEQHCALSDAKTLIAAGAARVRDRLGPHAGVAILTDPESGLAAARIAVDSGVPLALALEESGYRDLRLLGRPILDGAIDDLRPQWGKVLVRWNPRDSEERKAANLVALAEAQRICEGCGMEFLLELIVPPNHDDLEQATDFETERLPFLLPEAVREITTRLGPPYLWKVQACESPAASQAVAEASRSAGTQPRIVVLGAASDPEQISRWFRSSAHTDGYCGFAIGRSIWQTAVERWLTDRNEPEAAIDSISAEFFRYIDDYQIATTIHRLTSRR